ncbi:MAG: AMP-binding protein, partial [Micromonosporaceae bacterium]|nr:AMP-binding protein [Micromonosporaceae bacterium]
MAQSGLDAWLAKRRLRSPDKTALIDHEGSVITYRQFADGADRVSTVLQGWGIRKGDAVAYLGENSPEFLQTMFGTVQIGAVFVPVNTRLAVPEIAHVLADSGARVLIHDHELAERAAQSAGVAGTARVISTGEGAPDAPGLAALVRAATGDRAKVDVTLNDPAAIVYTSGTTGRAKGAVLSHGNLTWVAINCVIDYDVVSTDIALMISPLFHVASLGMGALPVILKGATMVLDKGFEP